MRFAAYAGTSMVLATGVIIRALHERANFYSACVYLAQSNACLMILTNLVLLAVGMTMLSLQRIFYGPLRPIEVEQLYEKAWFAVTETCLAMTIFREEVGGWFVVMFISLLIGKVWGWIGEGRVEILEQQPPQNPRLFHARLSTSLCFSILFELYMLNYCVQTVRQQARPDMMVMFAFEFAVLAVTSISTFARYTISLYEAAVIKSQTMLRLQQRREEIIRERARAAEEVPQFEDSPQADPISIDEELEQLDVDVPGWEEKGRYVFYLDLATDFFKLTLYLTFFCVLCMFYGMPIHIIRDVAMTIKSFYKRITDFVKYRHATKDMNDRYPDATAEEIEREDTCIICREPMRPWHTTTDQNEQPANNGTPSQDRSNNNDERLRPKKLPCNHILHFACLRSWLERQQNCPTCRQPVLAPSSAVRSPTQPQPNQGPGLQGEAHANAIPAPANNHRHDAEQNRLRYFDFGPIRFGFGAGRDIQGLAEQLNNQPLPHQQRQLPDNGAGRGYGFGLRFGRQPPAPQPAISAGSPPSTVQRQLQVIEQQLIRDINGLQAQLDQLHLVRALQGELARLRIAQANGAIHNNVNNLNPSQNPFAIGVPAFPSPFQGIPAPSVQAFSTNQQHQPGLRSGHPDLPPGLTLPEGWTLTPLQRLSNHTSLGDGLPTNLTPTTSDETRHTHTALPHHSSLASSSHSHTQLEANPASDTVGSSSGFGHLSTPQRRPDPSSQVESGISTNSSGPSEREPGASDRAANGHSTIGRGAAVEVVSDSIPQWGDSSRGGKSGDSIASGSQTTDEQTVSSAERRAAKGKGRATTVEDFEDGVD